jgi:nitroreductase
MITSSSKWPTKKEESVNMEFFEVLEKRRSVRKYLDKPVPSEIITKALEAALLAPSTSNIQPWEFYWVNDSEKKREIVTACLDQLAARTAPEIIIAVARLDTWKQNAKEVCQEVQNNPNYPKNSDAYYKKIIPFFYTQGLFDIFGWIKKVLFFFIGLFRATPRSPTSRSDLREMMVKTVSLACQNFMNAIVAQGYACCPMEGFDEVRIKKVLKLGRNARVVMAISVGPPDKSGIWGERIRLPKEKFLFRI